MTGSQALLISLSGISIVFLTLIVIAIMIKLTSAIVGSIAKNEKKPAAAASKPATKVADKKDGALVAAIVAAVSEETKLPVDGFKIVSIKEKK